LAQIRTALICLNGHIVNWTIEDRPTFNTKFCSECGAQTVDTCVSCKSSIRGRIVYNDGGWNNPQNVPAHCHDCGIAYPWTLERIKAMKELVALTTKIREEDKAEVIDAIILTTTETPRTPAAAERLKKYLPVLGKTLQDVITSVLSETARKILFPRQ
jgi:hypothetical protein